MVDRIINQLNSLQAKCKELWVRQVIRRPIWFTDKHGVTCMLQPDDQLALFFEKKSHYDDEGTLALASRILQNSKTVFDVGAHWGEFSLFATQFVASDGIIHVFEPSPYSFERLKENLSHSRQPPKRVVLNRVAVHNRNGKVVLNEFPPQLSAWNTLGQPSMPLDGGKILQPTHSEIVKAVTLDTYCQEHQIQHIDLLKIDVEGFEAEVIEGCSELLNQSRIKKIIFEISLAPLAGANRSAKEILETFASYGLQISRIGDAGKLTPVREIDSYEVPFFANYFAEASTREK